MNYLSLFYKFMSDFHSDKCSLEELKEFKPNVVSWLKEKGLTNYRKLKVFRCYNGTVRVYIGYNDFPNKRQSFRRQTPEYDENNNIIGWSGTRGIHSRRYADYISFDRDTFDEIKQVFENKEHESYLFYDDYIFSKLVDNSKNK